MKHPDDAEHRGTGLAFTGTVMVHALVGFLLFGLTPSEPPPEFPTVAVRLVAAPRPEPEVERPPPETVQRQAPVPERVPEPVVDPDPVPVPPPPPDDVEREPAPTPAPPEEPDEDIEPSTGSDPATLDLPGVDFPFPGYMRNIVAQIYRRWNRPAGNVSLRAEVLFFIKRDGSITNFQFIERSGSFRFDLEAQGAVEAAGNAKAFGPLPEAFADDLLAVSFFFDPSTLRIGQGND